MRNLVNSNQCRHARLPTHNAPYKNLEIAGSILTYTRVNALLMGEATSLATQKNIECGVWDTVTAILRPKRSCMTIESPWQAVRRTQDRSGGLGASRAICIGGKGRHIPGIRRPYCRNSKNLGKAGRHCRDQTGIAASTTPIPAWCRRTTRRPSARAGSGSAASSI